MDRAMRKSPKDRILRLHNVCMTAHSSKWRCAVGSGFSAVMVLVALAVLCGSIGVSTKLWAKEAASPLHVSVGDLAREPQRYDKQMVIVSGVVRSIEFQRGRRGSEYLLLTLEEIRAESKEQLPTVNVVTQDIPRVKIGEQLLVRGIYYLEGKQAGRPYERFIDAEEIKRESAI